ncbi:MAG: FAD-dependent oxidoreductase [Clostridiaceae bacterium]|nr:FAD-dependent oxidoreductase [Clostridiaceae bacterium]
MRVVIIGGGFAGVAAAKQVFNQLPFDKKVEIILIDKNKYSTMLPSLPDVSGNRVEEKFIMEDIEKMLPKAIKFINKSVDFVDFHKKTIFMKEKELTYDYLIFSPGSKSNFFNHDEEFQKNLKLDCLEDALRIRKEFGASLIKRPKLNLVISGAGFTGIELACNLYHYAKVNKGQITITLIEKAERILPMLSQKMSKFVLDKMKLMNINFITGEEVISFEKNVVKLKNKGEIQDAFFCWCSGVKMSIKAVGNHKGLFDGRIIVDEFLRVPEHLEVFVAGDAAAIKSGETYLRRTVNFAYEAGKVCGKNVVATIEEEKLKPFKAVDLGWVIPIYISSIGMALGMETKGRLGITMHYVMCGLKNYNLRNFLKYLKYAFTFVFTKVE